MRERLSEYRVINIKLKSENDFFFLQRMFTSLHKLGEIVYVHMLWYNIHVIIKKLLIVKILKTPILLQWNFKLYV